MQFGKTSLLAAVFLFFSHTAWAIEVTDYPELGILIDEMIEHHQFDEDTLMQLFDQADIREDILEIMDRPGEAQPWFKYKTRFLTREHVQRGRRFYLKNLTAIRNAEKKYGIPAEFIVAIIGVETNYGRTPGHHRVIDALTTLVLKYPRRQRFFRKELKNFLLLTREQQLNPLEIKGSYTGAIGLPQFMPSSYRAYAVDHDNNGTADLVKNRADAIGSVANYFHVHGWKPGEPVMSTPRMEGDLYPWLSDLGYRPLFSLQEFARYGIFPRNKTVSPSKKAALLSFAEESSTEYRLVYHNFYVITRYNNNSKYARAVTELGALLKQAFRRKTG